MVSQLPNELIDCILDKLYFDKITLLNCALVGRAWSCSSQRGIFHEIILTPRGDHSKLTGQLIASFDASPHLASYVQSLELRSFTRSISETLNTATVTIIHRLSSVRRLSLCIVDWNRLSPSLRESLTDVLRASSLIHFSLTDFFIPSFAELTSLLSQTTTSLKSLFVDPFCENWGVMGSIADSLDPQKTTRNIMASASPPRSIQLQHLGFGRLPRGGETSFMTWFQQKSCPFQFHSLSSLEICSYLDSATLQYFSTNLREMKLSFDSDLPYDYLKYTPHLYSLHLQLRGNPAIWIEAIFEPLMFSESTNRDFDYPSLQQLTIDLSIHFEDQLEWHQLTVTDGLFRNPAFSLLENVVFRITTRDHNHFVIPTVSRVGEVLREKLAFLAGSGKLQILYLT